MINSVAKMWNGRKVKKEVILEKGEAVADAPFVALHKAEEYLRMNACQWGSLEGDNPVGFMLGRYTLPQKWSNYHTDTDKFKKLDGVMVGFPDFRNGDIKIIFFQ